MNRTLRLVVIVLLLVVVAGGAALAVWFFSGNTALSGETVADELAAETETQTVFRIDQEESQVTFEIFEELAGVPTDVIGATDQVAGDILVDFDRPQQSSIGQIRVNARDLETDNPFRNRALQRFILRSDQDEFEFTEFQPTAIEGLPETVTIGEPFEFQVVGDLAVAGTTRPVTFNVTVTPVSETRLEGRAETVVLYPDFNLTIPEVPSVANVSDEVTLAIDFVALAVTEAAEGEAETTSQ